MIKQIINHQFWGMCFQQQMGWQTPMPNNCLAIPASGEQPNCGNQETKKGGSPTTVYPSVDFYPFAVDFFFGGHEKIPRMTVKSPQSVSLLYDLLRQHFYPKWRFKQRNKCLWPARICHKKLGANQNMGRKRSGSMDRPWDFRVCRGLRKGVQILLHKGWELRFLGLPMGHEWVAG